MQMTIIMTFCIKHKQTKTYVLIEESFQITLCITKYQRTYNVFSHIEVVPQLNLNERQYFMYRKMLYTIIISYL